MPVPLHVQDAVQQGDVALVRGWIAQGPHYGLDAAQALLNFLVKQRHAADPAAILSLLLDSGAQLAGYHIMHAASQANDVVMVRELCSRGLDPNHISEHNWTALHSASRDRHVDVVVALLDCGADPSVRIAPEDGFEESLNPPTPLMCAAASSHSAEVIRVLLSRSADFSATNAVGETAEDYAHVCLEISPRDEFPDDEDTAAWANDHEWRIVGEAERIIDILAAVRAAGSWKRYSAIWRKEFILLQRLCSTDRAFPLAALRGSHSRRAVSIEKLEATSGCKVTMRPREHKEDDATRATDGSPVALMARLVHLPPVLTWNVASYWRTARDPLY